MAIGLVQTTSRSSFGIAASVMLLAALTGTVSAFQNQQTIDGVALERMARAEFGNLSAAELRMLHTAPTREMAWASPSQDPDAAINDPAKASTWGPERTIRADLIEWLISDPQPSRLVHPSGVSVKAARISGKLDLSYLTIRTPLFLTLCSISDGIDLRYGHLESLDLQASWTGPITGDQSVIAGDVVLRYGHYGEVSFYRAEIGGNLEANGGAFVGDAPISAIDATIKGDALFHEDFTTSGIVD